MEKTSKKRRELRVQGSACVLQQGCELVEEMLKMMSRVYSVA